MITTAPLPDSGNIVLGRPCPIVVTLPSPLADGATATLVLGDDVLSVPLVADDTRTSLTVTLTVAQVAQVATVSHVPFQVTTGTGDALVALVVGHLSRVTKWDGKKPITVAITVGATEAALALTSANAAAVAQAAAEAAAAAAAGASDAGVAALVGSGPLTSAALSSTYDTVGGSRRSRTIILGDSIALGSDPAGAIPTTLGSWASTLSMVSGQRLRLIRNAGVAGNTTTQMLARIAADVIAYAPDWCLISGMINDLQNQIPKETTRANYEAMRVALQAAGVRVAVTTAAPTDNPSASPYATVTLARAAVIEHNLWLTDWAGQHGIPVIDLWTAMADLTTGGYVTGYTPDGIHPNYAAMAAAATTLAAALPSVFQGRDDLVVSAADKTDLLGGLGLFLGTPSSGLAAGWYRSGTSTAAVETGTGVAGKWQRINSVSSANSQLTLNSAITTGFSPGDVVEFSGRIDKTAAAIAYISLRTNTSANIADWASTSLRALNGVFRIRATVPAGTTSLNVLGFVGTGGDMRVAQLGLRNLTALGLV